MRLWIQTAMRAVAGTYFVLTSLYCLLAFLPYTYTAVIKGPPYAWMPFLAHHQAALYWIVVGGMMLGSYPSPQKTRTRFFAAGFLLAVFGALVTIHPFLEAVQDSPPAYWWSLASLLPLVVIAVLGLTENEQARPENDGQPQLLGYSIGLLVAGSVSAIYLIGAHITIYRESHMGFHVEDAEIAAWSLISHIVLAIVVVSVLNLIYLVAARSQEPSLMRRIVLGTLITICLAVVLARFLDHAMSFGGWMAWLYAAMLGGAITLWAFSLALPIADRNGTASRATTNRQRIAISILIVAAAALALASRSLIGGADWNGLVEGTGALLFWIGMSVGFYRLWPARANYSVTAVLGTLLVSGFVYQGLRVTEMFWARRLGSTDDEIARQFENYAGHDASFQLAHDVLGNGRDEACGELCHVLREYTDIRDAHITQGVKLVDNLTPMKGDRPNIFLFTIDSMRPDYLGAYNPQHVHYTPNLDALARESAVFKHAYTHYAGTSLSEPGIWTGALLLHAHYAEPFDEVDSLRTLARTDGYQMIVSYDTVVRLFLSPTDPMIKLDGDKKLWNQDEACSTIGQLESVLDSRSDKTQPVLFYAQPMNVHQFAKNDVPSPTSQHWQSPPGMNARLTYEVHWVDSCLGGFFSYLKQRGMYDNSIIVIASDHGDATGEFGRSSHSTLIWPEIMHVPLIIHLPAKIRAGLVSDDSRLSSLTDITPTIYYLLGHRPIRVNPLYGRPLLARTKQELDSYPQRDFLLASDVRAVYGILTADGRYLYTTYDSPAKSYLFDLTSDPNALHSILTPQLKQRYDEEIIGQLHMIADYYGYKPGIGSLLASTEKH